MTIHRVNFSRNDQRVCVVDNRLTGSVMKAHNFGISVYRINKFFMVVIGCD